MKKSVNLPIAVLGLIIALGVVFYLGYTNSRKKYNRLLQQASEVLNQARDSVYTFKIKLDSLDVFVSEQQTVILSKNEALDMALLDKKKYKALYLKEVDNNIKLTAEVKRLQEATEEIPDSVIVYVNDSTECLKLPYEFIGYDKWSWYNVTVDRNPYVEFGVTVPLDIFIGWEKDGLFKSKPMIKVATENPYVTIPNLQSIKIEKDKRWYNKWYVHAGGGIIIWEIARSLLSN